MVAELASKIGSENGLTYGVVKLRNETKDRLVDQDSPPGGKVAEVLQQFDSQENNLKGENSERKRASADKSPFTGSGYATANATNPKETKEIVKSMKVADGKELKGTKVWNSKNSTDFAVDARRQSKGVNGRMQNSSLNLTDSLPNSVSLNDADLNSDDSNARMQMTEKQELEDRVRDVVELLQLSEESVSLFCHEVIIVNI